MCHQVTYTLPCEHLKTQTIFCAAAPAASSSSSSSHSPSSRSSHSSKSSSRHHSSSKRSSSSSTHGHAKGRKPCKNLTSDSLPYPTPPSFEGSPSTAAASPLAPKCPLARCPFEEKRRCWNCCWCGKSWNEKGRCSCIMIIEGNVVQCEHICCPSCEAAG